uniref:Uncharacterized protein n=1 Tax=Timema tahoe TaxID=61484 RepID=A0A7R9ICR7_9NEOP|nr:unnamed protein product [Timema tahoe]
MSARTMFVTQEGPANALALNKDNSQVVIAGRNVFKIFTIGEDEFLESCNLRVGKNLNLNFSSNDVAWNVIEDARARSLLRALAVELGCLHEEEICT